MSERPHPATESGSLTSAIPAKLPSKQEALFRDVLTLPERKRKFLLPWRGPWRCSVRAGIDEAIKLERAMSQLRTAKRVVVLHYSPIAATVQGEKPEIYPFLGTSRLAEVVDRHGADLVLHGHAHHGEPDAKPRQALLSTTSLSPCRRRRIPRRSIGFRRLGRPGRPISRP